MHLKLKVEIMKKYIITLIFVALLSMVACNDSNVINVPEKGVESDAQVSMSDDVAVDSQNWTNLSDPDIQEYLKVVLSSKVIQEYDLLESVLLVRDERNNINSVIFSLEGDGSAKNWVFTSAYCDKTENEAAINYITQFESSSNIVVDNIMEWSGTFSIFNGNNDLIQRNTFKDGKLYDKKIYKTLLNDEGFGDCMQDAWDTLPWYMQVACGASFGGCVYALNPIACGVVVGCVGGMAAHCVLEML